MPDEVIFLCHASEDKPAVVRPLANALRDRGWTVWYDEFELSVGDSLRQKIDEGLRSCRYGIVVLSPSFFRKQWAIIELNGLYAREVELGTKIILPVWHNLTHRDLLHYSPLLADRLGIPTTIGIERLTDKIEAVLQEETRNATRDTKQPKHMPLVRSFAFGVIGESYPSTYRSDSPHNKVREPPGCPSCGGSNYQYHGSADYGYHMCWDCHYIDDPLENARS